MEAQDHCPKWSDDTQDKDNNNKQTKNWNNLKGWNSVIPDSRMQWRTYLKWHEKQNGKFQLFVVTEFPLEYHPIMRWTGLTKLEFNWCSVNVINIDNKLFKLESFLDEHTWSYSKMIIQNTDIDQICMR